jgi:hypothetical protein
MWGSRLRLMAATGASGGAFPTASVPIVLPAPGLFSMTKGWASRSDSH